jgi:hypothetical protein
MSPRPRRLCAAGLTVAGLFVLTACEKPTPGVTVQSGQSLVQSEALCWSEQSTPQPADCSTQRATLEALAVERGASIGIDVDPAVEHVGWVPAVNGQALVPEPIKDGTHYRFTLPEDVLRRGAELQVYAVERNGAPPRGLWAFRLRYAS